MSEYHECPYAKELKGGRCARKNFRCDGNGDIVSGKGANFTELKIVERRDSCAPSSIFGNYCYEITEEHIQALREGKILCDVDEYGFFIGLKKD